MVERLSPELVKKIAIALNKADLDHDGTVTGGEYRESGADKKIQGLVQADTSKRADLLMQQLATNIPDGNHKPFLSEKLTGFLNANFISEIQAVAPYVELTGNHPLRVPLMQGKVASELERGIKASAQDLGTYRLVPGDNTVVSDSGLYPQLKAEGLSVRITAEVMKGTIRDAMQGTRAAIDTIKEMPREAIEGKIQEARNPSPKSPVVQVPTVYTIYSGVPKIPDGRAPS